MIGARAEIIQVGRR